VHHKQNSSAQKSQRAFLGTDLLSVKSCNSSTHYLYVCNNIYNTEAVDDKRYAKDGCQQQYDVAAAENYVVFIPSIFAISGVNFPVGVLIYWSTTNVWTWGQQFYVIKRNPTPGSPAYEELERKRARKAKEGGAAGTETSIDGATTPEVEAPKIEGQRNQPKKKKKKK
jgi:membrane protein insertase Oxa1/YidC/SpoIIIJ